MIIREPSEFVPYTKKDTEKFFESKDIKVRGTKVEIERTGGFWVDVHLYSDKKNFVAQFIYVDRTGLVLIPDYLSLEKKWEDILKTLVLQACDFFLKNTKDVVWAVFPVDGEKLEKPSEECMAPGFVWNELYLHHIKRYIFASLYCGGKNVLDLSCGVGYGTKYVSRFAQKAIGVDINKQEIEYARRTYYAENLLFSTIDKIRTFNKSPYKDSSFDVALNFETLEHVGYENINIFLGEIKRLLKDDGIAVISTPNKKFYRNQYYHSHISLMYLDEFSNILKKHFEEVEVFKQQRPAGLFDVFEELNIEKYEESDIECEQFVAVCKGKKEVKQFFIASVKRDNPLILTLNWHEGFLYNFSKIGGNIFLLTYDFICERRKEIYGEEKYVLWNEKIRPIPRNVHFLENVKVEDFDVLVLHNQRDMYKFQDKRIPKIAVVHNSFFSDSYSPDEKQFRFYIENCKRNTFFLFSESELTVFISEHKRNSYGLPADVIVNGIDVNEYKEWKGDKKISLIVANLLHRPLFDNEFVRSLLKEMPLKIIGYNKEYNSEPAESFEELKEIYSQNYVYVNITKFPYEDGFNLSFMEAGATGMPIVTLENPTSPVENGVSGFVVKDAKEAARRIEWLYENYDRAFEIGQNAKKMVQKYFSIDRFCEQWRDAISKAMTRYKLKQFLFSFSPVEGNKRDVKPKKGRVVFVAQYLFPPVGGAEHTLLEWANILKSEFEVIFVCFGFLRSSESLPVIVKDGIKIRLVQLDGVKKALNELSPDIVITQLDWSPPAIEWAFVKRRKSIVVIPSYEGLCYEPWKIVNQNSPCGIKCPDCDVYISNKDKHERFKFSISICSKVVAISDYVRSIVYKTTGRNPIVVYQPISKKYIGKETVDEGDVGFITLITGTLIKGIDIFMELSKRFPRKRFMVVGRSNLDPKSAGENVILKPYLEPRRIWGMSELLLVPSQWPEPFGRVIPEALLSGVPVLASKVGGIPEAIPYEGALVEDFSNIDSWTEKLNCEKEFFEDILHFGKEHSTKFLTENLRTEILKSVES